MLNKCSLKLIVFLTVSCLLSQTSLQAQNSSLIGFCSAEAFNSDFLVETVTIPKQISKTLGFTQKSAIKGIRAKVLCSGRYKLTRVSLRFPSAKTDSQFLITDENYSLITKSQVKPGKTIDLSQTVCKKTIYFIPAISNNSQLNGYANIEKTYSSNVVDGKCIVNNTAIATDKKNNIKAELNISRIIPKIGDGYNKPY